MSKSRVVELRFQLGLPEPKNQDDPIQVWLPIPISTPQQDVISIQSGGTLPVSMGFDPIFGNAILHAATDGTDRGPVRIEYRALIERKEWKVNLAATQPLVLTRDVGLLAPQLSETRKIRFLPDIAKRQPKFTFIPFGIGPRVCAGAAFATAEMTVFLAVLLRRFVPVVPSGWAPVPYCRLTLRPRDGMPLMLARR